MGTAFFHVRRAAGERKAALRKAIARFGETSTKIFTCPGCGAPVADSGPGRMAHAERQSRCREAMGL